MGIIQKFGQMLVVTLCSLVTGQLLADTSVWQVSNGQNVVYLGGTVHLLRPGDYPLPEEFEQAYKDSSELVFETDLASLNDLAVQAQMMQQLTYSDGRTLKTVLSEEAYSALDSAAADFGIPLLMLDSFKPGMVISTLQVLAFQRIGFTPMGVDAYFNGKAAGDAKALGQLETVQEQIGFLATMGEGYESEFILMSLQDVEEIEDVMETMIQAWREGDSSQLASMFVDDMKKEAPDLYDTLLLQRNLKWLPQIENMLADGDTEFVLVGAAHLVGSEGLLELLGRAGYKVSQL